MKLSAKRLLANILSNLLFLFMIVSWMLGLYKILPSWAISLILFSACYIGMLSGDVEREKKDKKVMEEAERNFKNQIEEAERNFSELKKYSDNKDDLYDSFDKRDDLHEVQYITTLYSCVVTIRDHYTAEYLRHKKHPAPVMADKIEKIREEKRDLIEQNQILMYKYEMIFSVFPELSRYVDSFDDIRDLVKYKNIDDLKENYDHVRDYISKDDYERLSPAERNQLALDKYIGRKKTDWQIGRDYELYCGYFLSTIGFGNIRQFGIEKRLEDMGRDILAERNGVTYVIQCKNWSQKKEIHENHIAQLYGTTIAYALENKKTDVKPLFMTTAKLSPTAVCFAERLGVEISEVPFAEFPRIKCNISASGEKIYHLPFDQKYDATKIDKQGEFYAWTIREAEKKGFRRAFRWHGNI